MKESYLDNTIEAMKKALEINGLQETEEYKRLQELQEKREKLNGK